MMVDPEIWGPSGWILLHGLSFKKNIDVTKAWYLNLQNVLPCCTCQENFKMHSDALGSMHKDVRKWVYKLHERVNKMKGKPTPTFGEVVAAWKHRRLTWDEMIPFLDAVVEAHPIKGHGTPGVYWEFWEPLLRWMNVNRKGLTKEITESRGQLRIWWKKYKKYLQTIH
jgi:hypothetical protein